VVIDTSTFIAAIRSQTSSASVEVVRLALEEEIVILMDYKLASEYRDVGMRPVHLKASGYSKYETEKIITDLEAVAQSVEVWTKPRPLSSDPDDDMVLDLAINGRANVIVTQNVKHFAAVAKLYGIQVLRPADLLKQLSSGGRR